MTRRVFQKSWGARLRVAAVAIILLAGWLTRIGSAEEVAAPWDQFAFLEGSWTGSGEGFGQQSEVSHRWEFIFDKTFLRLTTESVEAGGAVHHDVGYLSYDTDRKNFVFRQFLSEGYVNTYDVIVDQAGKGLTFSFREAESAGGMAARLVMAVPSADQYEMTLELAGSDREFKPCQHMNMRRKNDG